MFDFVIIINLAITQWKFTEIYSRLVVCIVGRESVRSIRFTSNWSNVNDKIGTFQFLDYSTSSQKVVE